MLDILGLSEQQMAERVQRSTPGAAGTAGDVGEIILTVCLVQQKFENIPNSP